MKEGLVGGEDAAYLEPSVKSQALLKSMESLGWNQQFETFSVPSSHQFRPLPLCFGKVWFHHTGVREEKACRKGLGNAKERTGGMEVKGEGRRVH